MARALGDVLSVLLVEGPTERLFYGRIKRRYLEGNCACTIEPMNGLFNINEKVLHALATRNTDRQVRAYCCFDRESRYAPTPGFDLRFIRAQLKKDGIRNVLSLDAIIATQMIESWFFHDYPGICAYLKVPRSRRNPKAYVPVERYRVKDLKALFSLYGKRYSEGDRAEHFINKLDIERIYRQSTALKQGIELILNNHGRGLRNRR